MGAFRFRDTILIVIIIGLLILVFSTKHNVIKEVTKEVENTHKLDSLTNLSKLYKDSIKELSAYLDTVNSYNDKLKLSLNQNILELKKLKNEKHKKDSVINSASVRELSNILTERYNKD